LLPGGGPRVEQPRGGGDRVAGVGVRPATGEGPGRREPRACGEQHFHGPEGRVDAVGRVRPERQGTGAGRRVGHGGGGRGGTRPPGRRPVEPRRLSLDGRTTPPGEPLTPEAFGQLGNWYGLRYSQASNLLAAALSANTSAAASQVSSDR